MKLLSQGSWRTVNKTIAKQVGVEASLLLSHLCDLLEYFGDNLVDIEGDMYFYSTSQNIEEKTTLSYRKQKNAIKKLEEKGFIKTHLAGVPAKLHFTICENKILQNVKTRFSETQKLDLAKCETNNNIINNNKEKEYISKDITAVTAETKKHGNKEINILIEKIKQTVEKHGYIYKPAKDERQRARNIMTAKAFGKVADKANMTKIEFSEAIVQASFLLPFWRGKITNASTIYKHYDKIYNDSLSQSQKKTLKSKELK